LVDDFRPFFLLVWLLARGDAALRVGLLEKIEQAENRNPGRRERPGFFR
jgi:hypothetical protein